MILPLFFSIPSRPNILKNIRDAKEYKTIKNTDLNSETFTKSAKMHLSLSDAIRVVYVGTKVLTLVKNGYHSLTNAGNDVLPMISSDQVKSVGNNRLFIVTNAHVGKPKTSRIVRLAQYVPNNTWKKTLSDSLSDYQNTRYRSQLHLRSGYNEKCFTFLMEDQFMTVSDVAEFYKIKDPNMIRRFREKELIKDVYGASIKTVNRIKIQNRLQYYSGHIKIHMVKMLDSNIDVRDLIRQITSNMFESTRSPEGKLLRKLQYSFPDTDLVDLDNRFAINFLTDLSVSLNDATRFTDRATICRTWTMTIPPGSFWQFNFHHHLGEGYHLNRVNDLMKTFEQPRDPDLKSLLIDTINDNIDLEDFAKRGKDKLKEKITQSQKTNMVEEMLDTILDKMEKKIIDASSKKKLQNINRNNAPMGYFFVLETLGDRRATIVRNSTKDIFNGYSPTHFHCEFEHQFKYIGKEEDDCQPAIYVKVKKDKNFTENPNGGDSTCADIFYTDRKDRLHVKYDDIQLGDIHEDSNKEKEWTLEYDESLLMNPDYSKMENALRDLYKERGKDPNKATPQSSPFEEDNSRNETSEEDTDKK